MTAIRIILASALITIAAIKGAPAVADPVAKAAFASSIVRTADLDLTTESGRKVLDHRLVVAAREVCGSASDADLAGKNMVRACRNNVLADARAKTERLASRSATIVVAAR